MIEYFQLTNGDTLTSGGFILDDFEKKELEAKETVSEEVTETQETAAEALTEEATEEACENEADALVKELEEIRDMFQEAIDNAAESDEEDGELIQELDYENDAEEDEEKELPICECCAEAPVSTLYGEDYPYCDNCRELMKRYPLRISGVLAILAMIVVFGLSAYLSMDSLDNALTVLEARTSAAENKMMSTVQTLYTFTSGQETDSRKAVDLLIDGFIRTGYISNAKETVEKYYTEKDLKKASNKKYKRIVDFVDNFLATRDAVQDIVAEAFSGEDFDCDELTAQLDAYKEKFLDEENGIRYNVPLIEYYKYELLRLSKADLQKQLEVLKGIEKDDKYGLSEWIYVPTICEVAAKMGDKELAEKYFEKMKETNAEDMKAYTTFALYYRFLEAPDADAMIELCNEAAKNAYQGDYSYYPTLVIAYLIKGEGALAFDTMTQYMNSSYYSVPNCNLFALCALYCGDTETYDNMEKTLANSGFAMSELVKNYKDKKITIEQAIADMRGDIG